MRRPETPQKRYMAVSPAGAWLVAQSKATPSEYYEAVDGEFGHISGPPSISQGSSPAPQNKTCPCVEVANPGQPGAGASPSGSISIPAQVPPPSPSSRSRLG